MIGFVGCSYTIGIPNEQSSAHTTLNSLSLWTHQQQQASSGNCNSAMALGEGFLGCCVSIGDYTTPQNVWAKSFTNYNSVRNWLCRFIYVYTFCNIYCQVHGKDARDVCSRLLALYWWCFLFSNCVFLMIQNTFHKPGGDLS